MRRFSNTGKMFCKHNELHTHFLGLVCFDFVRLWLHGDADKEARLTMLAAVSLARLEVALKL